MTFNKISRRQLGKIGVGALTMTALTSLPGVGLVAAGQATPQEQGEKKRKNWAIPHRGVPTSS
jgi:hypothetical protein